MTSTAVAAVHVSEGRVPPLHMRMRNEACNRGEIYSLMGGSIARMCKVGGGGGHGSEEVVAGTLAVVIRPTT